MTIPIGPYCDEGGNWWVPVESASYHEARAEVKSCADSYYKLVYRGKAKDVRIDLEHGDVCDRIDDPDSPDDGEYPDCVSLLTCWHFYESEI